MSEPKITPEVERASLAIAQHDCVMATTPEELAAIARSALRSLLPPSDAMIEAAAMVNCHMFNGGGYWEHMSIGAREEYCDEARQMLTAAIRAALGDEG